MLSLPQDQTVDSRLLEVILDYEYLTASYKLFWFSGIFKEIIRGNQRITFRRIVCRMIASAWYPLLQYHLDFGYSDNLNRVVTMIHNKYGLQCETKEEELVRIIENLNDLEVEKAIRDLYKFVPYRLLSPFYSDVLSGMKEREKNKLILSLSQDSDKALYKILMPEETIIVNDKWFEYIYKNQSIVLGWMNYKLIYFLQKKNPNVPSIPFKLSAPYQRSLTMAKKFWNDITEQQIIIDVYTGKPLNRDNYSKYGEISIDHFIPWSFVLHDELWNLIPTFKSVNSSKSNKLPKLELYMDDFCEVQFMAFNLVRNKKDSKKYLEDYLTINKKLDLNHMIHRKQDVSKNEFNDSLKKTILPLFQIAYNQGYELWQNNLI